MIDLHLHTSYSDGTKTVIETLEEAEKLGLKIISITDHESCKPYEELDTLDIKKYYSGKIIKGVEIKSAYKGRIIDVLGYNIDTEKMGLWLKEQYKDNTKAKIQSKYLDSHYEKFIKLGVKLLPKDEIKWEPDREWANPIIYRELKRFPENEQYVPADMWESYDNFRFNYCYNDASNFYIDKSKDFPKVEDVIDAIHECGGKAFIAHVYIYAWAKDKKAFIDDLITNYSFDGIECYYSRFTEEQIKYALEVCEKNNLFVSGGSDYHGANKKDISMGIGRGTLCVPDDIVEKWIKREEYYI